MYKTEGFSDLRHLWYIERICHNCLIGAGPTSGTRTLLKNGGPLTAAENGELAVHAQLSAHFNGSF